MTTSNSPPIFFSGLADDPGEDEQSPREKLIEIHHDLSNILFLLLYIEEDLLTICPDAAKCIEVARSILSNLQSAKEDSYLNELADLKYVS